MKITYPALNQLKPAIENHHVYWIFGDSLEYQDDVKHQVRTNLSSFDTFEMHVVENTQELEQVITLSKTKDLFATNKIICLKLLKNSFDKKSQALFEALIDTGTANQKIIITSPTPTLAQLKSKWMQVVEKKILIIEIGKHQINTQKIWLNNFCKQQGISLSSSAKSSLIKHTLNNPTASKQISLVASMIYPEQTIDEYQLDHTLQASPHYSLFELSDAILAGQAIRVHEIIQSHISQSTEIILMLWSIRKLVTELLNYKNQMFMQKSMSVVLSKVWNSKKKLYEQTLTRLPMKKLKHALTLTQRVDAMIKGQLSGDIISEFEYLCLVLVSPHLPTYHE